MENKFQPAGEELMALVNFFNHHHDKLLCTASSSGVPNIALMGTPRLLENGLIQFEISDPNSISYNNIRENKQVTFMAYMPGARARDYSGARIHAEVMQILTEGEEVEVIRNVIREKYGDDKAEELLASIICEIRNVRPIVDRGQRWDQAPFGNI